MNEFVPKTIIEPFQIKSVEPLKLSSRQEREAALKKASYNLFKLSADDVLIDLLTDSGTSAMSAAQWAALQQGDEAYAGAKSFEVFQKKVMELTGFKYIIPTHQGRASEKLLFGVLANRRPSGLTQKIPNNSHFDTTRANAEVCGFEALDFPCPEFFNPHSDDRFKGDMDLEKLEDFLKSHSSNEVPLGFTTITNNTCGGQPVSLDNFEKTAALYKKFGIPFYIDACRFAENAAFIHFFERPDLSPLEIAKKLFRLADGATFSAKKDALANIGGFLATHDDHLIEDLTSMLILTEGFPTYGGLAGRDLMAIAQGLDEILDPDYLRYRLAVTEYMGKRLDQKEISYLRPAGGHALYLDAKGFAPHLQWNQYPGQSLVIELFRVAGIRSCEIGSVMFGKQAGGEEKAHPVELVRLAIPRRVYTQSHMDYVLEAIEYVWRERQNLKAVTIKKEPKNLRHFSADFEQE